MHRRLLKYMLTVSVGLLCLATASHAQFKEEAFTQTYNENADTTGRADTTDRLFSFKEYFGGLAHKNTLKIGNVFAGSMILPGTAQIYNRDYWKLPVIYGGIGALAGTGGYYLHSYSKQQKAYSAWEKANDGTEAPIVNQSYKTTGTWLMVGAGLMYWGSLLDGVISFDTDVHPLPGKATIYSLLLPGLGQIYNGEFYKVPIYWGGLLISVHCLALNNRNYKRFKSIHNEATNPDIEYTGQISGDTAKWYRDVYRRYRDYSIVATALVYLLQVIDANVFAYMHDFELTDDITMNIEPAVIAPDNAYALHTGSYGTAPNALGVRFGLRF